MRLLRQCSERSFKTMINKKKQLGRKPVLTKQQEDELEGRLIRLAEIGMHLTPKSLRRNVHNFIELNRVDLRVKRNIVGRVWYRAFLRRHPHLSKRKARNRNPVRSHNLNLFIVSDYFKKLSVLGQNNLSMCLTGFLIWKRRIAVLH